MNITAQAKPAGEVFSSNSHSPAGGVINPLVSILINNHNYGRYLRSAIDSALAQTYSNVEVVVVDDGSADDSREILHEYGDRIHPILKPQGGQASAFNAGFAASKGEIIMFLDSDDLIVPEKASSLVEIFADPEVGWCFDTVAYFYEDGAEHVAPATPESNAAKPGRWDERDTVARLGYAPYIPAPTSALSFRRNLLERILPMPIEANVTLSDNYLKFLAVGLSPGFFTPLQLSRQRLHGSNAYTRSSADREKLRSVISFKTGFYLLQKGPEMRRMGINLSARGLADCWSHGALDSVSRKQAVGLTKLLRLPEILKVAALSAKHLLRERLAKRRTA